jgi:hypothetical protein
MDVDGAIDVRAGSVRRSRVVRAPRCWRYVGGKCPAGNGGKRAVLREEHEVSRKAIAQGRPECSRCPVCSCAFLFCANRTRDRGCSKHPVFPAPLNKRAGSFWQTSGAMRRENAKTCFRRMGGAKRYPSPHALALTGIASLHPSYGTEGGGREVAVSKARGTGRDHLSGHGTPAPGPP